MKNWMVFFPFRLDNSMLNQKFNWTTNDHCSHQQFLETWNILATKIDRFERCNYFNLYCLRALLFFASLSLPFAACLSLYLSFSTCPHHAKLLSIYVCSLLINKNEIREKKTNLNMFNWNLSFLCCCCCCYWFWISLV